MRCLPTKERGNGRWGNEETNGGKQQLVPRGKTRKTWTRTVGRTQHDHPQCHTNDTLQHSGNKMQINLKGKNKNNQNSFVGGGGGWDLKTGRGSVSCGSEFLSTNTQISSQISQSS